MKKQRFSACLCAFALLFSLASFSVNAAEWDRPSYPQSTVYATSYPNDFSGLLTVYPAFIGSTTYTSQGDEITVTGVNGWTTTTTTDGQAVLMYTISGSLSINSLAGHAGYVNQFQLELALTSAFSGITITLIDAEADGFINVGRTLSNNALYLQFLRTGQKIDTAVRANGVRRIPIEITVGVYIPTSNNSLSVGSKLKDYITSVTAVNLSAVLDDTIFDKEAPLTSSSQQEIVNEQMSHASNLQQQQQNFQQGLTEDIYENSGTSDIDDAGGMGSDAVGQVNGLQLADTISTGLFDVFSADVGEPVLTFPRFAITVDGVDYSVWPDIQYNLNELEASFSGLIAAVRFALIGLCYFALVRYLHRVYEKIFMQSVGGGD